MATSDSQARFDPFPSTHWSVISDARRHDDTTVRRRALAALVGRYLAPLRAYLTCNKRIPSDRAEDILQAFLLSKVLEDGLFTRANREKGRFRSFVLVALDRFVISSHRIEHAQKRGGGRVRSLNDGEEGDGEDRNPIALQDHAAHLPQEEFDLAWARQVLSEALSRMRSDCEASGRSDLWGIFEARVVAETLHGSEPAPYEELIERFNLESTAQAMNLLTSAKRAFGRSLRTVIGEYEDDPDQIDAEIADLQAVLSRSGNRRA